MQASYRLNASDLDENFLESLKTLFQDKEIEIVVYDMDEIIVGSQCHEV